jgi:hypothetical protein
MSGSRTFVERQTRLIEYSMSPEEKSLYDDLRLAYDAVCSLGTS